MPLLYELSFKRSTKGIQLFNVTQTVAAGMPNCHLASLYPDYNSKNTTVYQYIWASK